MRPVSGSSFAFERADAYGIELPIGIVEVRLEDAQPGEGQFNWERGLGAGQLDLQGVIVQDRQPGRLRGVALLHRVYALDRPQVEQRSAPGDLVLRPRPHLPRLLDVGGCDRRAVVEDGLRIEVDYEGVVGVVVVVGQRDPLHYVEVRVEPERRHEDVRLEHPGVEALSPRRDRASLAGDGDDQLLLALESAGRVRGCRYGVRRRRDAGKAGLHLHHHHFGLGGRRGLWWRSRGRGLRRHFGRLRLVGAARQQAQREDGHQG